MKSVRDIPVFQDIPILVRAAFNEPVENGVVSNSFRVKRSVATLQFLEERHARIVVISHIGQQGTETLKPVADLLGDMMRGVVFCPTTVGEEARAAIRALPPGGILILENLRRNRGEVMNDPAFAAELALLADVFVQDSFDTCHREHASMIGVPKLLPSYAGLQLEDEIKALTAALTPEAPSLAVIGGAKFESKEPVLEKLLGIYSHVFVGGALANDFLKASGKPVGQSLVSDTTSDDHIKALLAHANLVIPIDSVVVPKSAIGSMDINAHMTPRAVGEVKDDEVILDHGLGTTALLVDLVKNAKTILWNGPMGNYENGFIHATDALARAVAANGTHAVVGGGDTVASIENLGLLQKFAFVSTGGGAMLEFLAKGSLPGISVLG